MEANRFGVGDRPINITDVGGWKRTSSFGVADGRGDKGWGYRVVGVMGKRNRGTQERAGQRVGGGVRQGGAAAVRYHEDGAAVQHHKVSRGKGAIVYVMVVVEEKKTDGRLKLSLKKVSPKAFYVLEHHVCSVPLPSLFSLLIFLALLAVDGTSNRGRFPYLFLIPTIPSSWRNNTNCFQFSVSLRTGTTFFERRLNVCKGYPKRQTAVQ